MGRFFIILAIICIGAVVVSSSSAMLSSKMIANSVKKEAFESILKTEAMALAEQINLLNTFIDQQVRSPDVIDAIKQNSPELLTQASFKLQAIIPGVHNVHFLSIDDRNKANVNAQISFADLTMLKNTFEKPQPAAVQGDGKDRYLAIARTVSFDNTVIGVVLVGINYDFIQRAMAGISTTYVELRQDKLVLATTGNKSGKAELEEDAPINVPNTLWQLYYQSPTSASIGETSVLTGIVIVPALLVLLAFVVVYRLLSKTLREDMSWVTRGLKDAMTGKAVPNYPAKLNETKVVISTLSQFNRVVNDKSFEI